MTERPIIFSAPMVLALLEGRKTVTRRLVKVQPQVTNEGDAAWRDAKADLWRNARQYARDCSPYGVTGDRLWVRETCDYFAGDKSVAPERRIIYYRERDDFPAATGKWCSPLLMPRWASRITLEVADVRVERLQAISEEDAGAEGVGAARAGQGENGPIATHRTGFVRLWQSLNAKRAPWESNPFVWCISFRKL